MAKYKMIVFSQPKPGQEEEYNDWYQNVHLQDVVAIDGIISAQRYRLAATLAGEAAAPYAAIYSVEAENPEPVMTALAQRAMAGEMQISDAFDTENTVALIYEEIGPEVTQ